jgi:hypothetical protein
MPHTALTRLVCRAGALALYLVGTGLAPLADARLEARASRQTSHVEAQPDQACAPGHDHATCGLCTNLRSGATTASLPALAVEVPEWRASRPVTSQTPSFVFRPTHNSRAPPLS